MAELAIVLVMCGNSPVTTNLVVGKLEREAKRRRISIRMVKGTIDEMDNLILRHNPGLIIATSLSWEQKK